MQLSEVAYAKINLALHVRRKRDDGYHDIETLFAFCNYGDLLSARPATGDSVNAMGEFSGGLGEPSQNIIMRTLGTLPHNEGLAITLDKRLPVAAGLGGGSADAGAVFRLVQRSHGLPRDWEERAERLGADVPACTASSTAIGLGTGTDLVPGPGDLEGMAVLLVNPRIPVPTGPVFAGWDGQDRGPLKQGSARQMAQRGRNDLEQSAQEICPVIGEVLARLHRTSAWLVRMSGSGATCFALFEHVNVMKEAAHSISLSHPQWWIRPTTLR